MAINSSRLIEFFRLKVIFYRRIRKLTQSEVAYRAKISTRNYQRIESGEVIPKLDTLLDICNVLQIKLSDLFSLDFHDSDKQLLMPREIEELCQNNISTHNLINYYQACICDLNEPIDPKELERLEAALAKKK